MTAAPPRHEEWDEERITAAAVAAARWTRCRAWTCPPSPRRRGARSGTGRGRCASGRTTSLVPWRPDREGRTPTSVRPFFVALDSRGE